MLIECTSRIKTRFKSATKRRRSVTHGGYAMTESLDLRHSALSTATALLPRMLSPLYLLHTSTAAADNSISALSLFLCLSLYLLRESALPAFMNELCAINTAAAATITAPVSRMLATGFMQIAPKWISYRPLSVIFGGNCIFPLAPLGHLGSHLPP